MRVLNRTEFLDLPAGTFYAKGRKWAFDNLCVKCETRGDVDDWYYLDIANVMADDSTLWVNYLEDMLANGASYPMENAWGRDGLFERDALFLVFEKQDLQDLRDLIDKALAI